MSIQELSNTDISKYKYNFVPIMEYPLTMVVASEKKQLDLIKQHHQDRKKTNQNKLEYRTPKLKESGYWKILTGTTAGTN